MAKHIIVIDIVGLEKKHISEKLTPNIFNISQTGEAKKLETVFPAVTCTCTKQFFIGFFSRHTWNCFKWLV